VLELVLVLVDVLLLVLVVLLVDDDVLDDELVLVLVDVAKVSTNLDQRQVVPLVLNCKKSCPL
jgi:biopolymer transport protein ExbD